jgi:diadenosine tetraphosphate (Ap4A) HIT family hydrolase
MEMRADIMKAEPAASTLAQNIGTKAGQTVLYCHLHLIPRRKGDIDDPRGVRGVIPVWDAACR